MYLSYFALGALVGAVFRDVRAVACILPAAAVIVFIGLRDHQFTSWVNGITWVFGNMACFQIGIAVTGIGGVYLLRYLDLRKLRH